MMAHVQPKGPSRTKPATFATNAGLAQPSSLRGEARTSRPPTSNAASISNKSDSVSWGLNGYGHDFRDVDIFGGHNSRNYHRELPLGLPLDVQEGKMTPHLAGIVRDLGPREPLPTSTRKPLEHLAGTSLEKVAIHDNPRSHLAAGLLGCQAFTVGDTIAVGHQSTHSVAPNLLLAHEVAHTVQQQGGVTGKIADDPELQADDFAKLSASRNTESTNQSNSLGYAPTGLAPKVIWKSTTDLPGGLLLILDVDDGDFVGGCVKAIVPHAGVKLIQKTPHLQLFNLHVGFMTNSAGEYCMFFYESVTQICEMKCFKSKEELKEAWEEIKQWLEDMLIKVLEALAITALILIAALLAAMIAEAVLAALLVLA